MTQRNPDIKSDILATATRIFADCGCEGTTIRQIAQHANVSLPSIYHYFSDKHSLYIQVCSRAIEEMSRRQQKILHSGLPPQQVLLQFTASLCQQLHENVVFAKLLQRLLVDKENSDLDEISRTLFQQSFRDLIDLVSTVVTTSDAPFLAFSVYALAFGLIQLNTVHDAVQPEPLIPGTPADLAIRILELLMPNVGWKQYVTDEDLPLIGATA